MPGLWSILFGLGVFASRPYLPAQIALVAGYYLAAGAVLLSLAAAGRSLNPWGMGITFGVGQLLGALILRLQISKEAEHEPQET